MDAAVYKVRPDALCSIDTGSVVSAHPIRISSFMPLLSSLKMRMTRTCYRANDEGIRRTSLMASGMAGKSRRQ